MTYQARATLNRLVILLTVAAAITAVVQELLKPAEERSWHGTVFGFVPYDFRPPTFDRLQSAYWNPDDPRIFTDKVLGIGWAVNIPSLIRTLSTAHLIRKG